jgi:hypothetical protein
MELFWSLKMSTNVRRIFLSRNSNLCPVSLSSNQSILESCVTWDIVVPYTRSTDKGNERRNILRLNKSRKCTSIYKYKQFLHAYFVILHDLLMSWCSFISNSNPYKSLTYLQLLYKTFFYTLTITNTVTMQTFEVICNKFNIIGICIGEKYAQKWILTSLYRPK